MSIKQLDDSASLKTPRPLNNGRWVASNGCSYGTYEEALRASDTILGNAYKKNSIRVAGVERGLHISFYAFFLSATILIGWDDAKLYLPRSVYITTYPVVALPAIWISSSFSYLAYCQTRYGSDGLDKKGNGFLFKWMLMNAGIIILALSLAIALILMVVAFEGFYSTLGFFPASFLLALVLIAFWFIFKKI